MKECFFSVLMIWWRRIVHIPASLIDSDAFCDTNYHFLNQKCFFFWTRNLLSKEIPSSPQPPPPSPDKVKSNTTLFQRVACEALLMKVSWTFKWRFAILQSLINGAERDFLLMLLGMGLHANSKQIVLIKQEALPQKNC